VKVILKVAYDGRAFSGFQRQRRDKTVQGALEAALSQVLTSAVVVQGAGRTDAGVHATGQVVAFESDKVGQLARLCHSVNSVLRDPLAVMEAASLDPGDPFHPRYSAIGRTYSYFVLDGCGPREARLWSGRAWCLPQTLELSLAQQAVSMFLGEQDFSTFSYRTQDLETRVRRVSTVEVSAQQAPALLCPDPGPRLLRITITANGFLRRMVRLMAAGIVEAALGQRSLDDLRSRLLARDPARAPHPAPPDGLYLERIDYDPDPFATHRGTSRHALAALPPRNRVKA
jgi:tRNA pseudouridine38-40 synthase